MATLGLDIPNRRLIVPIGTTTVTVQEIVDQGRSFEDLPEMMAQPSILAAAGKDDLGGGNSTGITLTLINDWRLYAEPRSGPTWDKIAVSGGNVVAVNSFSNDPIENSTYANWVINQSTSPAQVETGVSGLTAAEAADLLLLRQWMTNAQRLSEGAVANFEMWADGANPDVDSPIHTQDVTDKDGNPIVLPEGAPARRTEAS